MGRPLWPAGARPVGAVLVRSLPRRRGRAVLAAWHGRCSGSRFPWAPLESSSPFLGGSAVCGWVRPCSCPFSAPIPRCRTQGRELGNTAPHTRAEPGPCVRRVLRKSGSLCAQPGGQGPRRPQWNRSGTNADARYRHSDGVVNIVRGSSTPRGGYNARRCQQRASVRTTRAHANNSRRRSSARQRAAPIVPDSARRR